MPLICVVLFSRRIERDKVQTMFGRKKWVRIECIVPTVSDFVRTVCSSMQTSNTNFSATLGSQGFVVATTILKTDKTRALKALREVGAKSITCIPATVE